MKKLVRILPQKSLHDFRLISPKILQVALQSLCSFFIEQTGMSVSLGDLAMIPRQLHFDILMVPNFEGLEDFTGI